MHSTVSSYSSWTSSTYKRYNGEYLELSSSTGSKMGNQYSSNVYYTKNYPSTRVYGGGAGGVGNGCLKSDSDNDNNAFVKHNYYHYDNNNVQGQRNRHYCHIERKYPLNYSSSTSSTISSSSSASSNYSADSFSSSSAVGTRSLSQRNHYHHATDIDVNDHGTYGNGDFDYDNKERNLHLARSYTSKPAKFTSTCTNLLSRFTSKLCLNDRKDLITDNINYQNSGKHSINNNNNDNDYLADYRNHIYASNKYNLRPTTGSNTMTNGLNRNANGSFISLNSSGSTSSFSSSGASSIDDHHHHNHHYRLNNNYTNLPPIHPKYSTKYSYTSNGNLITNDTNCGNRYNFRSPLLKTASSSAIISGNRNTTDDRLYNDRQLNSLTTTSSTSRIRTLKEDSYLSYNTNYNYNSSSNNRYQLRYQTTSGINNSSSSKYTSEYRAESSYLMKKFPTTTITPYRSYLVQKKSISRNYTRVFDSGFDHNSSVCIAILFV